MVDILVPGWCEAPAEPELQEDWGWLELPAQPRLHCHAWGPSGVFWTCCKLHTLAWVLPAAREVASLERPAASKRCTLAGNPAGGGGGNCQLQDAQQHGGDMRGEEHVVRGVATSSPLCSAAS